MAIFEDFSFDGFEGKLARPEKQQASPLPGLLVMPDAFGISAFSIGQAGRLAAVDGVDTQPDGVVMNERLDRVT